MNTIKFLNSNSIDSNTFAADISSIRSKFYANGICWTDSVQGKFDINQPFRVVLHTRNIKIDFRNPMIKECNGLVFEYNNGWKLLAMPQYAFCTSKISMKKLNDLYEANNYDVYEVLDATILTLYYYDGEWRISSTKGYDIGSTEMISGFTFMDAIKDLMETKYKAFKFDLLNKQYSYTIALRHSKYHIFDETKHLANRTKNVPRPGVDMNSYLMVMCAADTESATFVEKNVSGLPHQNPISLKDHNVHTLVNYARSAYAKYAKAYRLQNFKYKPLYGYILRAKNKNIPDEYSTIYIESELYRAVKNGLYRDNQTLRSMDYNRLVCQMALNHERYEQFRIMFQQFEPKFENLEKVIDDLAIEASVIINNDEQPSSDNEILTNLVNQFKNEPDVTPGIIKDALYNKQYMENIYELLA